MPDPSRDAIIRALRQPDSLPNLSLTAWELVIRQARASTLLARLFFLLNERGLIERVPHEVRRHLDWAWTVAQAQGTSVRREVAHIKHAMARVDGPVILLKGAAYAMAGLPPAAGRFFSDVDILVPKSRLPDVEAALMLEGWMTTHHNAYDQRYYRKWMHELPPMTHLRRGTVIDVHHTILPETARLKPDPARLLADAAPVTGEPRLSVLAPPDMVLHSATHLFYNEEFSHGLRDLVDLDDLLRHFSREPRFWERLISRAAELDLTRPLYYALRYATRILATPVPANVITASRMDEPKAVRGLMDALFLRALRPDHPTTADRFSSTARRMLYLRGHWLKMPPYLLAWHLTVKSFRREDQEPA